MKKIGIIFLIIISFSFTKDENNLLYKNYAKALNQGGTFQFFLVIKIKNLNTNEVREICTKGDFLQGAIHHEYKIPYTEKGLLKAYQIALKNKKGILNLKMTVQLQI
ncbi:hypothetical protein ACQ9BO_11425 [Flavobacterium sp. P21]|uniref:hypothetical protein n=1 Tax=Flavobacterium sp. P21 TaxID=3423948 RepID=UPI003D67EE3B